MQTTHGTQAYAHSVWRTQFGALTFKHFIERHTHTHTPIQAFDMTSQTPAQPRQPNRLRNHCTAYSNQAATAQRSVRPLRECYSSAVPTDESLDVVVRPVTQCCDARVN